MPTMNVGLPAVTSSDGKREILIARVLHDRMDPERHIAASD